MDCLFVAKLKNLELNHSCVTMANWKDRKLTGCKDLFSLPVYKKIGRITATNTSVFDKIFMILVKITKKTRKQEMLKGRNDAEQEQRIQLSRGLSSLALAVKMRYRQRDWKSFSRGAEEEAAARLVAN